MSFTKVEVPGLKVNKKVSIRPYFDSSMENMGLEKYGLSLHAGVYHTEQLCCIEMNGIKRYVTGLNEFAPEIKLMNDQDEKTAKIKEIRTVVAQLERDLAANVVEIDDPKFWEKVKVMRPDNSEFWDKVELKAGNDITFLDPIKDPYDLIKLYAIDAGGFTIVAKSLVSAETMAKPPKFYLDRHEETVTNKNVLRKLRNKALSNLQELYDTDATKLLYVTKVIDPGSPQYKKSTSNDTLYEVMDNYINGTSFEKDTKRAAQQFMDLSKQSIGDLKIRAMVKDAAFFKEIQSKADGYIYHTKTSTMMGRNPADVAEFLKNPLNEDVLVSIQERIEHEWNK
tara:strand:+ start:8463 stop:9479 length:1017 start_codon:yes stop_codon:yes gene_type:complete